MSQVFTREPSVGRHLRIAGLGMLAMQVVMDLLDVLWAGGQAPQHVHAELVEDMGMGGGGIEQEVLILPVGHQEAVEIGYVPGFRGGRRTQGQTGVKEA